MGGFYEYRALVACTLMMRAPVHFALDSAALAAPERVEPLHRLLGGTGLLVAVALLLAVPLVILIRGAARRRRAERAVQVSESRVDAWAESARRLKERP